jgi:hypothetical protein
VGDFIMSRSELEGMMCEELSAHRNELGRRCRIQEYRG